LIVFPGNLFAAVRHFFVSRARFSSSRQPSIDGDKRSLVAASHFPARDCRPLRIIVNFFALDPISLVAGLIFPAAAQTLCASCSIRHAHRSNPRRIIAWRFVHDAILFVTHLTFRGKIARKKQIKFKAMPDPNAPPPPTPPVNPPDDHQPKPRGYFNQAQLDDLETAESVLAAAQDHADDLAARQITADYIAGFATAIQQARAKTSATGQSTDKTGAAALNANGAERALIIALQGIQSAAKQKHRMLDEDDDPATNFSTDGYLIGERLNAKRSVLLQNADTLIAKANADNLPGYDAAGIKVVTDALQAYKDAGGDQQSADEDRGTDITLRDALIKKINTRRMAIQHAADALWPYTAKSTRPIRKALQLPQSRPFNG
jgi:hypothetical protein